MTIVQVWMAIVSIVVRFLWGNSAGLFFFFFTLHAKWLHISVKQKYNDALLVLCHVISSFNSLFRTNTNEAWLPLMKILQKLCLNVDFVAFQLSDIESMQQDSRRKYYLFFFSSLLCCHLHQATNFPSLTYKKRKWSNKRKKKFQNRDPMLTNHV